MRHILAAPASTDLHWPAPMKPAPVALEPAPVALESAPVALESAPATTSLTYGNMYCLGSIVILYKHCSQNCENYSAVRLK